MIVSRTENKPIEEARRQWGAQPEVWTERMMTALTGGVKEGKWHSLIDKVYSPKTLKRAWKSVRKNRGAAGIDRQSVKQFAKDAEQHLAKLQRELRNGDYTPQAVLRCWIDKPGTTEKRPLGIPAVRDRIVQTALHLVIGPIFEASFARHSYGFRPGRGCKDALREVSRLLMAGSIWVVDLDLKSYFDTILHEMLMNYVSEFIADGKVLELIRAYLKAGVLDGETLDPAETGTPQGAVISPLMANLYLNALDHQMETRGYSMIRYADDLVVLCRTQEEAAGALKEIATYAEGHGLTVHPTKTRLVDASVKGGFDFLGYHFERGYKWPKKKAIQRLRDTLRSKTKRTNGKSLTVIINKVNKTLKGWFEYFQHSHKSTFRELDGWLRDRIRSILRKRQKRRGRARSGDRVKWPNAYFTTHGLFSLTVAHRLICHSLVRATH